MASTRVLGGVRTDALGHLANTRGRAEVAGARRQAEMAEPQRRVLMATWREAYTEARGEAGYGVGWRWELINNLIVGPYLFRSFPIPRAGGK